MYYIAKNEYTEIDGRFYKNAFITPKIISSSESLSDKDASIYVKHILETYNNKIEDSKINLPQSIVCQNLGGTLFFDIDFSLDLPRLFLNAETEEYEVVYEEGDIVYDTFTNKEDTSHGYIKINDERRESEPVNLEVVKRLIKKFTIPKQYNEAIDKGLILEENVILNSWVFLGLHDIPLISYEDKLTYIDLNSNDIVLPYETKIVPELPDLDFGQMMTTKFSNEYKNIVDLSNFDLVTKEERNDWLISLGVDPSIFKKDGKYVYTSSSTANKMFRNENVPIDKEEL